MCDAHNVPNERGGECCGMGKNAGCLSLGVKRDEKVGVWWLDGVDVSVMAWCQTLCHCQCLPHQPIPQWSVTVHCVSKSLCSCHFNQCVDAAVLSHLLPFVKNNYHLQGIQFGTSCHCPWRGTCLPWVQVKVPSSTTSHCDKVVRAWQSWVIQNPKSCPWPILDSNYFIVFVLMHCS